jgi:hypothetical protein
MGQAKQETPRWRRKPAPSPQAVVLKGRHLKAYVAQQAAIQAAAGMPAPEAKAQQGLLARTGAYRFRRHLVPVWILLGIVTIGWGCHAAHSGKAEGIGIAVGVLTAAALFIAARSLKGFARKASIAIGALALTWIPVLALAGMAAPWPALLFASWLPLMWAWAKRYRWRPQEEQKPEPRAGDIVRWGQLAAEKKWNATLGDPEHLAGGGVRYPIRCDGIKTVVGNVLSASENVAGAWHKPMTEAYAERSPDGIPSTGFLTILSGDSLMRGREWDGQGIHPETGIAVVGRFADGKPAHVKFLTRRYGTRHALVSGTTGSGKTEFLNLIVFIAIASGFVPIILDPQEGQSLPFWRGRCLYFSGTSECISGINGLHAGMLDRSRRLSRMPWDDDGIAMDGMPFYDQELTGLSPFLIIFDEAHMVLRGSDKPSRKATEQTAEVGRLARKTGGALWLGTTLPSLTDLGGEQVLRDVLRGGNAIGFRMANPVATGMLGFEKDLSQIPRYFRNGKETAGLCYISGPDNRPDAPMRTDIVPASMKRRVTVPTLDERFMNAMDAARAFTGSQATLTVPAAAPAAVPLTAVPAAAAAVTAADAVLKVLDREMTRGEVIAALDGAYSIRTIGDALGKLTADGKAAKVSHGTYAPVRASLHAVSGSGHGTEGASAS